MAAHVEKCMLQYKHLFRSDLLSEKVAFVTGGATGIGFTISEVLMRHGCNTVIASRNVERLQHAAKELQAATGAKCLPLQTDIRKPDSVIKAVDETLSNFGKIDILVNNAAGNFPTPIKNMSYNAFKTVIDIDTVGTFNVSKTVYDKYFAKNGGVIVNISATLHYAGQVNQAHAGPAKAAIDALTKHMAMEWGPDNVRVTGVAPGPISDTVGYERVWKHPTLSHESGGTVGDFVPLGRAGTREEMANTVLFLASDAASYITGHTIVADGGHWMAAPNTLSMTTISAPTGR